MNTITVSATYARNNFFSILDQVVLGKSVVVKKDNRTVARVVPIIKKTRNIGLTLALRKAAKGFVYDKKDNPLRRPGSANFLGRWDK